MAAVFIGHRARVEQTGVLGTMVHASAGKGDPFAHSNARGTFPRVPKQGAGGDEAMANRHPRNRLSWNKGYAIWTWLVDVDRRQSTVFLIPELPYSVKVLLRRERKRERDEKERPRADKRGH